MSSSINSNQEILRGHEQHLGEINCKCSTQFLILQCSFAAVCSVQCIFPPTSSLFTGMSFCSAPVLDFLRLRLLLPFVVGVCVCFLLCRLSLLSLEPCRNGRGETVCPTLFTSRGVCCPLFKFSPPLCL